MSIRNEKEILSKLDRVLFLEKFLLRMGFIMAANFNKLTDQVAANTDAEASAILLLTQLHDMLEAALADDDPAAVQDIVDKLEVSRDALAVAMLANTPAAPPIE